MKNYGKHCVIVVLLLFITSARSSVIEFEFTGFFDRSVLFDNYTNADVNVGDMYEGRFSFSPDTPVFSIQDNNTRSRFNTGIIESSVNSTFYQAVDGPQLQIFNNWTFPNSTTVIDDFFLSVRQNDISGSGFYLLQLNIRDYNAQILNSVAIPTVDEIVTLSEVGGRFFLRRFESNNQESWFADGNFTSLSLIKVSAPSSPVLLIIPLIAFAILKKELKPELTLETKV